MIKKYRTLMILPGRAAWSEIDEIDLLASELTCPL